MKKIGAEPKAQAEDSAPYIQCKGLYSATIYYWNTGSIGTITH